jgi:hypothetical protein
MGHLPRRPYVLPGVSQKAACLHVTSTKTSLSEDFDIESNVATLPQ